MLNTDVRLIEMKSDKEVTIYDIAEALNISASTVSRGLRDHPSVRKVTKKKIMIVANKMGYQHNKFASNLRKKHTNMIGVVLPRLDSYFQSTIISGMEKEANKAGYNLIISQSQESIKKERASILTMFNSRVDGLLVSLAYDTENLDHLDIFFKKKIPVIFFDRVYDQSECTNIVIDNFKAGYDVTKHLIEQGCRRILHLGGNLLRNLYSDRFRGYKQALLDNGVPFDQDLVFIDRLNEEAGINTVKEILKMKIPPDGIFTVNDTTAATIICKLKEASIRVPDDIAVAGFNNDPISRVVDPNLTTINYPGEKMGEIAASTLIHKLKKLKTVNTNTIILHHELIIRQSSLRKR